MDIEPKDGAYFLSLAATAGAAWGWIRNLGKRVVKLERRAENEHGEPLLLTYAAHDMICGNATGLIVQEMRHVTEAVNNLTATVADQSEKMAEMSERVAVLDDRTERVAKPCP